MMLPPRNARCSIIPIANALFSSDPYTCPLAPSAFAAGSYSKYSRRAASPLVRLVEGKSCWRPLTPTPKVFALNWGGTELNRTVTCMVLKATVNDRRTSGPLP
ncbi:hypothetical protein TNCV_965391 [Trichonephila clavipes]|nr:hypothetical protein TNCV_965391 [Trichonephila clavipes]